MSINLLQKLCININLFDGLIQSVLSNKSIISVKVPIFLELKWESPLLHQNLYYMIHNLIWMHLHLHLVNFYIVDMKECSPLFFTLPIGLHILCGVILNILHQFPAILSERFQIIIQSRVIYHFTQCSLSGIYFSQNILKFLR